MLFDPDHMSVKARQASLALIEELGYGGVLSSHSWSTPDAYARIYQDHGFVAPYAGDSDGFVAKWRRHLTWANPQDYWGIGFGADINGLGAQGDPRPDAATNPVTYPFTTLGGVTVEQQVSGQRTYDINSDGVSHYGLYPDWIQDLKMQAGPDIVTDLARGPEAYLQMWERAYGVPRQRLHRREPAAHRGDVRLQGAQGDDRLADAPGRRPARPAARQHLQLLHRRRHGPRSASPTRARSPGSARPETRCGVWVWRPGPEG